jgi:hypothetical protein
MHRASKEIPAIADLEKMKSDAILSGSFGGRKNHL